MYVEIFCYPYHRMSGPSRATCVSIMGSSDTARQVSLGYVLGYNSTRTRRDVSRQERQYHICRSMG